MPATSWPTTQCSGRIAHYTHYIPYTPYIPYIPYTPYSWIEERGGSPLIKEKLQSILDGEKAEVVFDTYDWTLNNI